ncbi:ArsR/SmtB family transcription factor [Peribacillus asahii]|uniref:ArsR/SmtB family transcription factor n=1 Tax=Peribacillus asahii TaxID=228899 RepID=UPI0037F50E7A
MADTKDYCEVYSYDEPKVNRVQQEMSTVDIASVSRLFKVIGDENRVKIAYLLSQEGELCVCDISNIIGASMATTSHHLRTLLKHAIVKFRKEGKLAFYSLDDNHIKQLMMIALEHQQEVKVDGRSTD